MLRLPPEVLVELSDHVTPAVTRYLARVPTANALFVEIARRDLSTAQIARLREILDREFPSADAARAATLSSVLTREGVVVGVACASFEDTLDLAAMKLAPRVGISAQELARRMMAREAQCASLIGEGAALPHLTFDGLRGTQAAILTFTQGVAAPTADGVPIRLVVAFATDDQPPGTSGRLLAACARLAKSGTKQRILGARDADEVLRAVAEHESVFG